MKFTSKSFDRPHLGRHQGIKKFFKQKWVQRTIWILAFLIFFNYTLSFIAHSVARVLILEFIVALTPHEPMDGVNILAFGIDETEAVQRSDAIMLFHLNPNNNKISVLSIPRDTRVQIENKGMRKINHAYAYGGPALLKKTTEVFLGIPIDYYLQINLKGVETLIDELGGLSMTVEKDLKYQDLAAGLSIDVSQGTQTLTGRQAIQYLRYRQDNEGDIGRIRRQQTFIQATANKLGVMGSLMELPSILFKLNESFSTDMSPKQMMGLSARFLSAYKRGTVETATIPGNIRLIDGISYWKPDLEKLEIQLSQLVIDQKVATSQTVVEQPLIETPDIAAVQEDRRLITHKEVTRIVTVAEVTTGNALALPEALVIEVLNGTGEPKIAMKAAKKLKGMNLKIKRYGNAGAFSYTKTLIVDWKGQPDKSLAVAQALGVPPENIIIYDRPDKPLDITIVLGTDWTTYFSGTEGL